MEDSVTEVEKSGLYDNKEEGTAGSEKERSADEREERDSGTGSSGVITNFISALVSNGGNEEDGGEAAAAADTGGGAGGFIDNIVSHLPAPLSGEAAPAAEEACMLIHSIVHD